MVNDQRLNKLNIFLIICIFVSTFILFDNLRNYFLTHYLHLGTFRYIYINFIAMLCLIILVFKQIVKGVYNFLLIFIWISFFLLSFISLCFSSDSHSLIVAIFCFIFPLTLLGVNLSKEEFQKIFSISLSCLNIFVIVIFILGILDYMTKGNIQTFLLRIGYFDSEYINLINYQLQYGSYRLYSILGHPLRNSQLFLTFFILNTLHGKYIKKKMNPLLLSTITLIGVTLTGSKVGVLSGILLIVFFNSTASSKEKWFYRGLSLVGLLILFNSNIFSSTIMERISNTNDLSGGRTELIKEMLNGEIQRPHFIGEGLNYSFVVSSTSLNSQATSFEYPFIMFSYDLGTGATLLMFFLLQIYPLLKTIMHKNYFLLFIFIVYCIDINSYNGMTNLGDYMMQVVFIIFIILNMNKYITNPSNKQYYKFKWKSFFKLKGKGDI